MSPPKISGDEAAHQSLRSAEDRLASHQRELEKANEKQLSSPYAAGDTTATSPKAEGPASTPMFSPVYTADGNLGPLSALFKMTNQQRLLLDANDQLKEILRSSNLAVKPVSAGNAEASRAIYRRMGERARDIQKEVHRALSRQGDTTTTLPTIRVTALEGTPMVFNPQAQAFIPVSVEDREASSTYNPEAQEFKPAGK